MNITSLTEAISTRPLQINGTASLQAGGYRLLRCASLALGAAGALDLADNALLVDYTGPSPLNMINAWLHAGYAGGAWNGVGIRSSIAAANPLNRALGIGEANTIFHSFPASIGGFAVPDNSAVLIRFTFYGDANLDRTVDISDLYLLASNWRQTSRRWDQGDFNFDSTTNAVDLGSLSRNWQAVLALPAPAVPADAPVLSPRRTARRVVNDVMD
jgi:hypothetical protein